MSTNAYQTRYAIAVAGNEPASEEALGRLRAACERTGKPFPVDKQLTRRQVQDALAALQRVGSRQMDGGTE